MSDLAAHWRKYDDVEVRLTAKLSERMLDLADLRAGMKVLDVACGRGEPAIGAAQRVGPRGQVLGIDSDAGVLELARERAAREGVTNLHLRVADAERFDWPGPRFDRATCRWGLMLMRAPEQALRCIHRSIAPDALFVAAVWAEPERVPYAAIGRQALAEVSGQPFAIPPGPGVFQFADERVIRRTWSDVGFAIEHIEELEVPVIETRDGHEFLAWLRGFKWPFSAALEALGLEKQRQWEAEVVRRAEQFRQGDQLLIGGTTRLVVARPSPRSR